LSDRVVERSRGDGDEDEGIDFSRNVCLSKSSSLSSLEVCLSPTKSILGSSEESNRSMNSFFNTPGLLPWRCVKEKINANIHSVCFINICKLGDP
jgi:hypothetical protein